MKIFGIVNLSSNSFSGDSLVDIYQIEERMLNFSSKNAYGIDIGAHATNPNAKKLDEDKEMCILQKFLPQISKFAKKLNLKLSIDTFYPKIANYACGLGFDYINDVNALKNEAMIEVLQKYSNVKYILTHSLSAPVKDGEFLKNDINIMDFLINFCNEKISILNKNDISIDRIIFDPGIGFGKNTEQNWTIVQNFEIFKHLKCKTYLAHSRKKFLSNFTENDIKLRDLATSIITKTLENKIDYVRIHKILD